MAVSFVITEGLGPVAAGVGGTNLQLNSVGVTTTTLTLTFSDPVFFAGDSATPANWTVMALGGAVPMNVTGAVFGTLTVVLTITAGTIGGSYVLVIPNGIVRQADSNPLIPPYTYAFNATGVVPVLIQVVTSNDAHSFDVIYSEPVVVAEATLATNYSISPTLHVASVVEVNASRYTIMTVEAQTPGTSYTVTVSNVHDMFGNPV